MARDVFLSHSSADKATAQAVLAGLEGRGIHCWIAPRDIAAGSEYGQEIVEAIKSWITLDSDFDALCSHPRYQKVLELIG